MKYIDLMLLLKGITYIRNISMVYKGIIAATTILLGTFYINVSFAEGQLPDVTNQKKENINNSAGKNKYTSLNDLKDSEKNIVENEIMQNRYDMKKFDPCDEKNLSLESQILSQYSEKVSNELGQYKKQAQLLYDNLTAESKEALDKIKQKKKNFLKINNCDAK